MPFYLRFAAAERDQQGKCQQLRVLPATSASPSIFMTSPPWQEKILSQDATIPSQVARTALTCFFW